MGMLMPTIACVLLAQPGADLVLRGHEPAPAGQVSDVSLEGVVVDSGVAAPVVVGWDRVRSVGGEHADEAAAFAEIADLVWRARERMQRGDIPAAEQLFEQLFVTYRNHQGPTAAVVCEGLLRCRLSRNAHTLAVGAWLGWLHAISPGNGPQWYQRRRAPGGESIFSVDQATGLMPDLPPIWVDLPAVQAFARTPVDASAMGPRERDLAGLYVHAARVAAGWDEPMPEVTSGDEGVRLVADLVSAQGVTEEERAAGRRAIAASLRKLPQGWVDAWLRTALGVSLLMDANPEERQRGVIELVRVRVLHERDCPYLAGLALARAAVGMVESGDLRSATMLRREFLDRFPGHPAASWDRIVLWPEEGAGAGPTANGRSTRRGAAPSHHESRTTNG